jgi:hypothetical protein
LTSVQRNPCCDTVWWGRWQHCFQIRITLCSVGTNLGEGEEGANEEEMEDLEGWSGSVYDMRMRDQSWSNSSTSSAAHENDDDEALLPVLEEAGPNRNAATHLTSASLRFHHCVEDRFGMYVLASDPDPDASSTTRTAWRPSLVG